MTNIHEKTAADNASSRLLSARNPVILEFDNIPPGVIGFISFVQEITKTVIRLEREVEEIRLLIDRH